jgi:GNAT superfamily N-acetyltransferase
MKRAISNRILNRINAIKMTFGSSISEVTEEAIKTPLSNEKIVFDTDINISFGFDESWVVYITEGKNITGSKAGRVLLGYIDEPAGGIKWYVEDDKMIISHFFLDEDLRGKGVMSKLIDVYKKYYSNEIIISGPFSDAGLVFARKKSDKIINYD